MNGIRSPLPNEDEPPESGLVLLPGEFGPAVFTCGSDGRPLVRLTFVGKPPAGWRLCMNETDEPFLGEGEWLALGGHDQMEVDWDAAKPPPYGFTVHWTGSPGGAWWPVNIESQAALPPPDELRTLPLEVLIDLLTSGRPMHKTMRKWLNRRHRPADADGSLEIDPHRRVDTSAFLLQRTRRVSWALKALRERLERPVSTRESLVWRLEGPVGVRAVADALAREAKSPDECGFLLTELALELTRARPAAAPETISVAEVRQEINRAAREVLARVDVERCGHSNLRDYVRSVVEEVRAAR